MTMKVAEIYLVPGEKAWSYPFEVWYVANLDYKKYRMARSLIQNFSLHTLFSFTRYQKIQFFEFGSLFDSVRT